MGGNPRRRGGLPPWIPSDVFSNPKGWKEGGIGGAAGVEESRVGFGLVGLESLVSLPL